MSNIWCWAFFQQEYHALLRSRVSHEAQGIPVTRLLEIRKNGGRNLQQMLKDYDLPFLRETFLGHLNL